jgi:hypothetical protein
MKKFLLVVFSILAAASLAAQQPARVVLHLQSADTLVHRALVNQISNMKKELPDAEIAVVCHGPGMDFLLKEKSRYINRILAMNLSNINFTGCAFTMKQRNIQPADLVPAATIVPFALVEIVKKQQANWIYVKLGF